MGDKLLKNNPIQRIFNTMEYSNGSESVQEALDWIQQKNDHVYATNETKGDPVSLVNIHNDILCNIHIADRKTVENLLNKVGDAKNKWFETAPTARTQIMHSFANEVEKNLKLIEQLEIETRGILSRDTRNKSVPLLTEYIRYYSRFCIKHSVEKPGWKPQGVVVAIFSDRNSLASFGWILGPVLASGFHLILQTDLKLTLQASLFVDLAKKVGIPDGTVNVVPGNTDPDIFFSHKKVSTVVILDDLYKEKYTITNQFDKNLLHLWSDGTSTIVYDDADLDSACQNIIESAFSQTGMLPWSTRLVLVQETIYDDFVRRLKYRASQLKIGPGDATNIDISFTTNAKFTEITEKAHNYGLEVYQPNPLGPALIIGGIFQNNVIKEHPVDIPLLNITAFRTINESINLANNTRHSLGISIWTDSTSLTQEAVRKLKFANIWINSHGMFKADVAIKACKSTSNAYFGGAEGFSEIVSGKTTKEDEDSANKNTTMEKLINESKKAQETWAKFTENERFKQIENAAISDEKNLSEILSILHSKYNTGNDVKTDKTYTITTIKEPMGVVAIEDEIDNNDRNILITAALLEGNSLIILEKNNHSEFYKRLGAALPKGLITAIDYSTDCVKTAALHKELDVYLGKRSGVFKTLPLNISRKYRPLDRIDSFEKARNIVSWNKNAWFNVGQSFI